MRYCNRRIAMSAGVLVHWVVTHCDAGDAAFSRDGKRIYALGEIHTRPAAEEIERGGRTSRDIALTQVASNDWLRGITCSDEGRMFCTTKRLLCSFDPVS